MNYFDSVLDSMEPIDDLMEVDKTFVRETEEDSNGKNNARIPSPLHSDSHNSDVDGTAIEDIIESADSENDSLCDDLENYMVHTHERL